MLLQQINKMYRPSNERFNQNNNMNPINSYPPPPPHHLPKMHLEGFPSAIPPPMYYDPVQNTNNYEYLPPNANAIPPPNQNFERGFPAAWRDVSESKGPIGSMGPTPQIHGVPPTHYDVRAMSGNHNQFQPVKPPTQNYMIQGAPVTPQVNIVQRISGIIKSQLNALQGILIYADKKTSEEKQKRDRSRSRSRDRDNRSSRRTEREKDHREWNCSKCSFLNFDFRDRCKRCNQTKPQPPRVQRSDSLVGGKNYVPGPDDWRCMKCNNINYARRTQCHRCHAPKGK